ncbi:MAG: HAD family hydrolase [Rhodobacteraceae bacterium]|nr:HAD family hydrolase [Paracoccaceae bacterium]
MPRSITTLGLDADDTLWHNEEVFQLTQELFTALLADFAAPGDLRARLLEAERRNLGHYGFGVKGFTLSMIETAIEVTEGRVPARVLGELVQAGREMLEHPIELLPGVEEAVARLAAERRLILITKGDLLDQERKLAQSGLGAYFSAVEVVSHKTPAIYHSAFRRHGDGVGRALMAGNSLASDIRPALEAGAWAVHVPHALTWALDEADRPKGAARFRQIAALLELPDLLNEIEAAFPDIS